MLILVFLIRIHTVFKTKFKTVNTKTKNLTAINGSIRIKHAYIAGHFLLSVKTCTY